LVQAFDGYTFALTLREDDEYVLRRAVRDADRVPVLVLTPVCQCPALVTRLEHEYALRAELDPAWAARPLALLRGAAGSALVLEDAGAAPLALAPGQPLAPLPFLELAAAIVQALVRLHSHDIVHKDLKPAHILIDPASGQARLTGFGIAVRMRPLQQAARGAASGSFAYMAPEQTGRMDRAVDTRSDLYALGVTLYQMLTGVLPFVAADPMQWIHCHVAREPVAPTLRLPGIEPALSEIVQKLMAKSAERRYQTAFGLAADLRHCLAEFEAHGRIAAFTLGRHDGVAQLQAPAALVGREAQSALLEQAAGRVAAGGAPELVLLSGPAGTGKSALMAALLQTNGVAGAMLVAGKFDQYQRDIPYATLAQAFRKQVRRLLDQSAAALDGRRRAILEALGPNARLMLDLIPELRLVIGEHEAPAELPPAEAQRRFQSVFRQFLGALADADSLLVLCLDDMQWIDPASLKLLAHLLAHPQVRHLLVLGAYRSGEVAAGHPLALAKDAMHAQGTAVSEVTLAPLRKAEVRELVGAALGCAARRTEHLADLVYAKTGGNPFFTLQFLARLSEHGLLRFDHAGGAWQWDAAAIETREYSDNVVDLMVARLQQLPYSTLELVKLLACLGQHADLACIALVSGMSQQESDECLWPAARLGLVVRDPRAYRFLHERVHEAAYSLIARASLAERHLHIGRLLLAAAAPAALEDQVFGIVNQLNRARAAMRDPAELSRLAQLNFMAGKKARSAIAYESARHYLASAAALTPPDAWLGQPEATFELHFALAECEYLCGHFELADVLFAQLSGHARSPLDQARIALLQLALYQMSGRFERAVAVALDALALFGVRFPVHEAEVAQALAAERAELDRNMAGRPIAALLAAPAAADPATHAISALFSDMGSSVFNARPALYPLLAAKALNLALCGGTTATTCMSYSRYAIVLVAQGAIPDAFAFSELALELARRCAASSERLGRLGFVHGAYIHSWREPVAGSIPILEQAFTACQESGDLPHAGYAAHIATWNSFEAGAALDEVQQRARGYQAFAQQQRNEVLLQLLRCYAQLTLCLQGASGAEGSVDGQGFRAADAFAIFSSAGFGAARARYHLMRQIAAFTFGRYPEALEAAAAAAGEREFFLGSLNEATHYFYHALTVAALYHEAPAVRQAEFGALLALARDKLALWASHCPANFDNRYLLVSAEMARIAGSEMDAMRDYDAAIASARRHGFVQNAALAAELAAAFYRARGADKVALAYAREALLAYRQWGAHGKVRQLERLFPVPHPGPAQRALASLPDSAALHGIDTANGLHFAGADRAFYLQLLDRFRLAQRDAGADLRRALACGAEGEALQRLDTLCGVAANVGADAVEQVAHALAQALAGGLAPAAGCHLAALEATLADTIERLDRYLAVHGAPADPAPPPALLARPGALAGREQLLRMLGDFDGAANDYFESVRASLATLVGPHLLARLSSHIAQYEFEAARLLLAFDER
jgi:predicted ATPase/HPt (histidine-containing phosphotransfer) domain-containing protein